MFPVVNMNQFDSLEYVAEVLEEAEKGLKDMTRAIPISSLAGGPFGPGPIVFPVPPVPIILLTMLRQTIKNYLKRDKLHREKLRLLKLAIEKQHAIVEALKKEVNAAKERVDYLDSLNVLLQHVIGNLWEDVER
jgi:hypothetical protein